MAVTGCLLSCCSREGSSLQPRADNADSRLPGKNFTFYLIPVILVGAGLLVAVGFSFYLRRRTARVQSRMPRAAIATNHAAPRVTEITKALLNTIPIVPFHSLPEGPAGLTETHLELGPENSDGHVRRSRSLSRDTETSSRTAGDLHGPNNVICAICADHFATGQCLRVLPCGHQFHPTCVDPWLLERSSTCPMCRSDLRPESKHQEGSPVIENQAE